jgi:hypothetical protein
MWLMGLWKAPVSVARFRSSTGLEGVGIEILPGDVDFPAETP